MIHPLWTDEYWVLLMQLYLKKPVGIKSLYSKPLVALSLELHIPPKDLYAQMFKLRRRSSKSLQRLWQIYADNPKRLSRDVRRLRQMQGFSHADLFYAEVPIVKTFELDFEPISQDMRLMPIQLIIILDLYFRLTPIAMTPETPEVTELSREIRLSPQLITSILLTFCECDPYLKHRGDAEAEKLFAPCSEIWKRYGNGNPETLAALAAQLKDYWK